MMEKKSRENQGHKSLPPSSFLLHISMSFALSHILSFAPVSIEEISTCPAILLTPSITSLLRSYGNFLLQPFPFSFSFNFSPLYLPLKINLGCFHSLKQNKINKKELSLDLIIPLNYHPTVLLPFLEKILC